MKSQLRPGTRVEVPAKPSLIATRMKRGTIVPMPANWHFPAPHWHAVRFDHNDSILPMEVSNFRVLQ
jgi:hypothetical protein